MPRIAWVEDQDATGALADIYAALRQSNANGQVPDIARTMSAAARLPAGDRRRPRGCISRMAR